MERPRGAGGRIGLCGLLNEHAEAVEYDLLVLGYDLQRDLGGRLTWRRLRVILTHLPQSSAFKRQVNPDSVWDLTPELLASLIDTVNVSNYYLGHLAGGKPKKPKPIQRPSTAVPAKAGGPGVSIEHMDQILGWGQ